MDLSSTDFLFVFVDIVDIDSSVLSLFSVSSLIAALLLLVFLLALLPFISAFILVCFFIIFALGLLSFDIISIFADFFLTVGASKFSIFSLTVSFLAFPFDLPLAKIKI